MWLLLVLAGLASAQVAVRGRVVDETGAPVDGARIELDTASATSDAGGNFSLTLPQPGEYRVAAEKPGFFALRPRPVRLQAGDNQLTLTLNHLRELAQSVDVAASPPFIDAAEPAERKQLTGVEIVTVPFAAPHDLRNSLALFQGAIQDRNGRLHFNGGAASQANFTLDGFNISDPVSGVFEARLNIDAVRSLDFQSSRFPADRAGGSAAGVDIRTHMGDDRWRVSGTNFFPGVTTQRGLFINQWTPRATLSGPIQRSRAWFSTSFDTFYDVDLIRELPRDQDRNRTLTANNLTRAQVNVTPAQILTLSFLSNYSGAGRYGLSFLDPVETTTRQRQTLFMPSVRHQIYLSRGALIELGFAESHGARREQPRGNAVFEISPMGRRGNYFVDLDRRSTRRQWIAQAFVPAARKHQVKLGLDVQRQEFDERVRRHAYRVLRADSTLARAVVFSGGGPARQSDFQPSFYVLDRWSARDDLHLEAGLRTDWDQAVRGLAVSPRLSAALAPAWLGGAKLSAGLGVFHDALSLGALTRYHGQSSLATFFRRDGAVFGPVPSEFLADTRSLRIPRAQMLSFSVERALPGGFHGAASYLRRRGRDGLAFVREPGAYVLRNAADPRYDAVELSARRAFAGGFEWFGGYTYSRARSNAVVEYSLENPIFADQAPGPLDWDAPHRFLTWGWAPLPVKRLPRLLRKLAGETNLAWLAESRSGFPFSAVNEEGVLAGRPNGRRFPTYFTLNVHFERRFRALGTSWAWRFGLNNITNHGNPNVVNNNLDSEGFLSFNRGQPRAFNVRLRFLGRQ